MKKILALLLALVMCISLVACGNTTEADTQKEESVDSTDSNTEVEKYLSILDLLNKGKTSLTEDQYNFLPEEMKSLYKKIGDDYYNLTVSTTEAKEKAQEGGREALADAYKQAAKTRDDAQAKKEALINSNQY